MLLFRHGRYIGHGDINKYIQKILIKLLTQTLLEYVLYDLPSYIYLTEWSPFFLKYLYLVSNYTIFCTL